MRITVRYEIRESEIEVKKMPLAIKQEALNRVAATYFPRYYPSIIGSVGLNFSVRNGKRCTPTI